MIENGQGTRGAVPFGRVPPNNGLQGDPPRAARA